VSLDLARRMLGALPVFAESLGAFYCEHREKTFANAPIEAERNSYTDATTIDMAYDQAAFLADCACDNLIAFHKTMIEPIALFGPWVCVRAAFETSAHAAWLAEPRIGPTERAIRGFAFRYKNLEEQVKFLRAWKRDLAAIQKATDRLRDAEETARRQNIKILKDKRHKTTSLGMQMPTATQLVVQMFDDEPAYRLLSGMTHGYPWISRLVLKPATGDDGISPRVKAIRQMPAENVIYLCARVVRAVSKAVWYRSQQLGWNLPHLRQALEATFDNMNINNSERFWR
jgi:hypothetical protein